MGTSALIGLGSNMGDRAANLGLAVAALSETPGVALRAVSRMVETPPVGGPGGQGPFLNAAAALETDLAPEPLLDLLQSVEARAGRVRGPRWGERTLDLDLLLYGDEVIRTPRLRVPHPRMALRRFVLAPLAEVAPRAVDPVTGRTVADLLAGLDRRPGYVALASVPQWDWLDLFNRWLAARGQPPALPKGEARPPDPAVVLRERLGRELRASALEDRVSEADRERFAESRVGGSSLHLGFDGGSLIELATGWLDRDACAALSPDNGWLVSHFWFDALFLSLDSLKSCRPRFPAFVRTFLEAREKVLPPTFVVARRTDMERLGLHDPRYAWRRPVGWDTPVLEVDDFETDSALSEVLSACAATRAG